MKKIGVVLLVVVILVGAAGYVGRHKIKSLLAGPTPTPAPTHAMMPVAAPTDNIYKTATDAKKGTYLTDFQGMTLYVFDKDTPGMSNCTGKCLTLWPVYTSGATAQKEFPVHISVITRSDGSKQFAWDNKPLYYYAGDSKAGDLTGDGIGGIWHIVTP